MILLAYGAAGAIAILAATVMSGWVRDDGAERIVSTRILAGMATTAYGLAVVGVVALAPTDGGSVAAWAIAAIAVIGAVSYGAGLQRWTGSTAWLLRLTGWLLLIGSAAVPSHLTLLLPMVAGLAVTLFRARPLNERPHRTGPSPGILRRS